MKKKDDWIGRPLWDAALAQQNSTSQKRVDTRPALVALIEAMDGGYKAAAGVFGVSRSGLVHAVRGKRPPPTLDTLAVYARRAFEAAALKLSFTVNPAGDLEFEITDRC